jgi:cellulose synthase (UDP-forming)
VHVELVSRTGVNSRRFRRAGTPPAFEFGFVYLSRPHKGRFKKAGDLRYGYERSSGDFVAVFDADFPARPDFLTSLLPYFDAEPDVGIVQSPQFFRREDGENWIARGAVAVQEFFYRAAQTSRQARSGAICVGTNAIYRRAALASNGGDALIEHSEDVHTGFDLYRNGWRLRYVPVNLATGLCPSTLPAFLAQQYRWCMGSMSLLTSDKF